MVVGPNLPQRADAEGRRVREGRLPAHLFLHRRVDAHLHVRPAAFAGEEVVDLPLGLLLGQALVEVLEDQFFPDALHFGVGLQPSSPLALPLGGCGWGGARGGEVKS